MADVAVAAGVAVQTVYFTFRTKPELLQACYERAVLGPDDPRRPQDQDWYAEMLEATDGLGALRAFARGNTSIAARVGVLDDVVRSAAHEPEAVAIRARSEGLRRKGYGDVVEHFDERFGLDAGLNRDSATDVLLAFGGTAMYRSLVLDYGWPEQAFVDWLARTLAGTLLA